jgi:XTP/dITP diphosphohydrolase
MKLVFATQNQGKIKEMQALLQDLDINVLSAKEVGVTKEVVEDKETFEGNALKKSAFCF